MKKYFGLMLIALLTIAFSATAYAADLKASGYIRMDSEYYRNVAATGVDSPVYGTIASDYLPNNAAFNRRGAYMMGRARLKLDVVADKSLSGTVFLEIDSDKWGDPDGSRGSMGYWTGDRAAVEVKNAYIDFGMPYLGVPLPMTVRAGLQGLVLRSGMLYSVDGIGFNIGLSADPVTINPFWFKPWEGQFTSADDVDVYGLNVSAKLDKITVGAYVTSTNLPDYPIPKATTAYGSLPTNYKADFWWLGLYSDGTSGPIKYNFDFVVDNGKVENKVDATKKSVDFTGWATRMKVDYPWEKYNFGGTFMYASGADQKKTDGAGLPGDNTTAFPGNNSKVKAYVLPPGTETGGFEEGFVFYNNFAADILNYHASTTGSLGGKSGNGYASRAGIGGTWMAKIYGKYQIAPWYQIHLQAMYIGDTTANGNTVGNARKADNVYPRDDKAIGWELGMLNTFKIMKGLTWHVATGYLFPGKALEYYDSVKVKNVKPDDPFQVVTRLLYEF